MPNAMKVDAHSVLDVQAAVKIVVHVSCPTGIANPQKTNPFIIHLREKHFKHKICNMRP